MPFIQLKPAERSFIELARNLTRRLSEIILCEGATDAEILKLVAGKPDKNVGVTDCGGVRQLYEVGRYIAALARCSRRLETIGVIVDADKYTYVERANSLINSLKAHELQVSRLEEVSEGLYETLIEQRRLLICIAGLSDIPVKAHSIEDHLVKALILEGRISIEDARGKPSSKDLLNTLNTSVVDELKALMKRRTRVIDEAFRRLINFVDKLQFEDGSNELT